jgi:hypothetical protein
MAEELWLLFEMNKAATRWFAVFFFHASASTDRPFRIWQHLFLTDVVSSFGARI